MTKLVKQAQESKGNDADEGYMECPMCGGEGTIPAETVITTGRVTLFTDTFPETYGLQVFGIGDGVNEIPEMIDLMIKHYEKLAAMFMGSDFSVPDFLKSLSKS